MPAYPQPTALPSARGLDSYLQMSSAVDPRASNYQNMSSSNSSQVNASGRPLYSGSVLGASTNVPTNTYTGQFINPDPAPSPTPAPGPAPSGGNAGGGQNQSSGGGGGIDMSMIDKAYSTLDSIFGEQESGARKTAGTAKENIGAQYSSDVGKTETAKEQQLRDLQNSMQQFQESGSSAIDDLVRQYNALEQRANVRYGGGSLGDLMRELAAKEYYKQTGGIKKQQLAGEKDFATQMSDAKLFFQQKIDDLGMWKKQAMDEVENRLSQQLSQIGAMRGQSQMDRANKQLELLQRAQEQARQITAMDLEFKNNMLSSYIENAQATLGRAFTPQEIANLVPQFFTPEFNTASQSFSNFNQYNPSALNGDEEDELNKIMGPAQ